MPVPVLDAANAEVGSRLRTVTSTSNNDKSLVRIFFKVVSSFFAKDKQTKFPWSAWLCYEIVHRNWTSVNVN